MDSIRRVYIFLGLLIIAIAFYVLRLINLQLALGNDFLEQSQKKVLRNTIIQAPRGEICDRLGRPLVTNRKGYTIYIEKDLISEEKLNDVLLNLSKVFTKTSDKYIDTFPVSNAPYTFISTQNQDNTAKQFAQFLTANKLPNNIDAQALMNKLIEKYELEKYIPEDTRKIAGIRYELDCKLKSSSDSYAFAPDVKIETVTRIRENAAEFPGVSVEVTPIREYVEDDIAANILGRVGSIFAEEYPALKEKGYKMNDTVGKDGIEKTCEEYLKGKDGLRQVEKNTDGQVTAIIDSVNPEPGNNVILTIDKDLQRAAEQSLRTRIDEIIKADNGTRGGFDARGGSAVAIDVNTGEILALATYPSYKLSEYSSNFAQLVNDPLNPLLNRPISGAYTPGSIFKMVTGIAALDENVITTSTSFNCTGKYTFFDSYQPSCYHGTAHGAQNVIGALRYSCNAFFFDAGRQVTIEKLNSYTAKFGLGVLTGIELTGEVKGIIAGKAERELKGERWNPGDTIQAAIGQSDNMFTPLQFASYIQTVAANGTRYKPHIVKSIKDYHFVNTIKQNDPIVVDTVPMSPTVIDAIKYGMRRVILEGSAAARFNGFGVEVAGKTGTAQVPGGSSDGAFVAFAPYDKPQIAIAVQVEHGGEGGYVSIIARDIFEKYFASKELNDKILQENVLLQ
jgi:penicillin-binding protein 2